MKFSSEHLAAIRQVVDESSIRRMDMRENIIDHLSCAVEYKLLNGISFENALQTAIYEFAPNGFKEIEFETEILLHPKTIIMKKLTYLSGLLFSIAASFGSIFKILHLPGANELTVIGFAGLAIVFAPLLVIVRQKAWKSNIERSRKVLLLISIITVATGIVLKVLRLAGSETTLLTGLILFTLGFLPLAFFKMYKESMAS